MLWLIYRYIRSILFMYIYIYFHFVLKGDAFIVKTSRPEMYLSTLAEVTRTEAEFTFLSSSRESFVYNWISLPDTVS